MASEIILIIITILCILLSVIFIWKLKQLEYKDTFLWLMPFNTLLVILNFCLFSFLYLFYIWYYGVDVISKTALFFMGIIFCSVSVFISNFFIKRVNFSELLGEDSGPKVTLPSKLKRGNTYLIKDREKKRAFRLFSDAVGLNFKGLTITRQNPKNLLETFDLKKTKVIWLTEIKNGKNLSPTDLEEISYVINNFISSEKRSIVLFDGFEYLSDYNSFNKVLHLFQVLKDNITVKKSILILYINPKTFEKNNIKMLEAEFKTI